MRRPKVVKSFSDIGELNLFDQYTVELPGDPEECVSENSLKFSEELHDAVSKKIKDKESREKDEPS